MIMNTVENSKRPSVTTRPQSILWLYTIYEDMLKHPDFIAKSPSKGIEVKCPGLQEEFWLEVEKTADLVLISCKRKRTSSTTHIDDGYFLLVYFYVTGIQNAKKSEIMYSNENSVTVSYPIDLFSVLQCDTLYVSTIKCIIVMIETSELIGDDLDILEKELERFTKKFSKSQLKNMAYLLKKPKVKGIFTSRESLDVILMKLSYVERSLPFSKHLVGFIRDKKESKPQVSDLPLDEILCQIHCGKKRAITEEECINLYLNTIRIGLRFLSAIVSDYIVSHLNDEFVLHVMRAADYVNDSRLFGAARDYFLINRKEILESGKWETFSQSLPNCCARSIIHNIKISLAKDDLLNVPGLV